VSRRRRLDYNRHRPGTAARRGRDIRGAGSASIPPREGRAEPRTIATLCQEAPHFWLAPVYAEAGRLDRARAEVEEIRRLHPDRGIELLRVGAKLLGPLGERCASTLTRAGLL
jgi:hypothetical protein